MEAVSKTLETAFLFIVIMRFQIENCKFHIENLY